MAKHTKIQTAIIIAAVCGIVVIAHWPALSAKALSFDDQQYLSKNILVQNPSIKSAARFLTEVLEPSTVAGYYQPLAMISLTLDYAAGGSDENLRPFHITSLALHAANTSLVIILLYMLFGNIWAAAAAGLLFGVHPMTVEPIPWVAERKTLLAAFFSFWSLILYVRYSRSGGWKAYAGCFLMFLLPIIVFAQGSEMNSNKAQSQVKIIADKLSFYFLNFDKKISLIKNEENIFLFCHLHFFCYNATLKNHLLGGYGQRFSDKILALRKGSDREKGL